MVILIIHENRVLTFKRKYQPPIPADADCPMPLKVSMEWMQSVTGSIHIRRLAGHVQCCKQDSKLPRMRGLNSSLRSGFGKKPQPFVPVAPNHVYSV